MPAINDRGAHHEGEGKCVEGAVAGIVEAARAGPHLDDSQHLLESAIQPHQSLDNLGLESRVRASHAHVAGYTCTVANVVDVWDCLSRLYLVPKGPAQ